MKESAFESIVRYLLGVCAAGALVMLVMAGSRGLSLNGAVTEATITGPQSGRVALESGRAKEEKQRQAYLEQKIGECYSRGGVARLDPMAGYTGCDLPVPKSRR
jgi:hypothetical protein